MTKDKTGKHPKMLSTTETKTRTVVKATAKQMKDYKEFMADKTVSQNDKNFAREVHAENLAQMQAESQGHQTTVTPVDKGNRGGPDFDTQKPDGTPTRVDSKSGNSRQTVGQKNPGKTLMTDPNMTLERKGQFQKGSRLDQAAAESTTNRLKDGRIVESSVSNTRIVKGGFATTTKSQGHALPETGTKGGAVTKGVVAPLATANERPPGLALGKAASASTKHASAGASAKAGSAPTTHKH